MRSIMLCFVTVLAVATASAQITVPQPTVEELFTAGNPLRIYFGTGGGSTVDIGQQGGENVYDFSSLYFVQFKIDTVRQVSTIPYLASRFPGNAVTLNFGEGPGSNNHPIFIFEGNEILLPGDYEEYNADSFEVDHASPFELFLKFPVTYGESIQRTSTITDSIFVQGALSGTMANDIPIYYVVDGWGTLKLPGGEERPCLRLRWYEDPSNYEAKDFEFVTDNGIILHIESTNDQPDEGFVELDGPVIMFRNTEAPVPQAITVTRAEFETLFTPGEMIRAWGLDETATVDVGEKGGPNVYDFSDADWPDLGIAQVYAVSEVPFLEPRFPADAVTFGDSPQSIRDNAVLQFTPDAMLNLAEIFIASDSQRVRHRTPPPPAVRFPATLGMEWEYAYTNAETTYVNDQPQNPQSWQTSGAYVVDGFGLLLLGGGYSFECLRITRTENLPGESREILYITREGVLVSIQSSNSEPDTGPITALSTRVLARDALVSVPHETRVPSGFALSQNYPNPFNPTTNFEFRIADFGFVSLKMYDLFGREIATVVNRELVPGVHRSSWDASGLPSGVYFYTLRAGGTIQTRKLLLVK